MSETEERQARDAVVRVSHALYMRGLSPGTTGNISIRLSDGRMVVTPTSSSLGFLAASDLALVDADGTVAKGSARPSKETALHQVFYERADIGAVVHLHSGWAVALSCLDQLPDTLGRLTPYFVMKVGSLSLVPYSAPGGAEGSRLLHTHASGHHAALLANHGLIAAGATLLEACNVAEEIEQAARLWFALRSEQVRTLGEDEIADLARRYPLPTGALRTYRA
jgi:ribulose-5-phosphate 4-epimerase/fuculose-1-phosphate aldolase